MNVLSIPNEYSCHYTIVLVHAACAQRILTRCVRSGYRSVVNRHSYSSHVLSIVKHYAILRKICGVNYVLMRPLKAETGRQLRKETYQSLLQGLNSPARLYYVSTSQELYLRLCYRM